MRLAVPARRATLATRVRRVETARVGTGVGDVLGNKGAVACALRLEGGASLAFVGSHLQAFQAHVAGRNADFRDIVERLSLGHKGLDLHAQYDHVFWCGDLNYRVDLEQADAIAAAARGLGRAARVRPARPRARGRALAATSSRRSRGADVQLRRGRP